MNDRGNDRPEAEDALGYVLDSDESEDLDAAIREALEAVEKQGEEEDISEPAPEAAPEAPKPPPGYEQVSGAGKAQAPIEAPPLVIVSYVVIWLLTLLYLFYLWLQPKCQLPRKKSKKTIIIKEERC